VRWTFPIELSEGPNSFWLRPLHRQRSWAPTVLESVGVERDRPAKYPEYPIVPIIEQ
jgi:hypothetical protein